MENIYIRLQFRVFLPCIKSVDDLDFDCMHGPYSSVRFTSDDFYCIYIALEA